jgi:hypothetical protein
MFDYEGFLANCILIGEISRIQAAQKLLEAHPAGACLEHREQKSDDAFSTVA